jgi:multidrug resistance efflux pump
MRKLKQKQSAYKLGKDIRQEQLRLGKYIYLTIIIIIAVILIHILFSRFYMAEGSGFVYSDNALIELQYEAKVTNVLVKDGERVKKGQLLFRYQSLELQQLMQNALIAMKNTKNQLAQKQEKVLTLQKQIAASKHYSKYTQDVSSKLEALKEKGLVSTKTLTPEANRNYNVTIQLHFYEEQLKATRADIEILKTQVAHLDKNYQSLLAIYNGGEERAPVSGVITSLNVKPGQVLETAETAMQIFHGNHYVLAYINQDSWIKVHQGDHILVNLPGEGHVLGRVVRILPITEKLPEEFQPRFKSTQRHQVVRIEANHKALNAMAIMSTVKVYKPFGLGLWSSIHKHWGNK